MGRFEGRARERETEARDMMRDVVRAADLRDMKDEAGIPEGQGPQVRTVPIVTRHRTP